MEESLEATWWESLDQMLARMDIISVNCPHTPATYHLLSARRLKLLQPGAYIVNTARGEIIDENALARMIESGAGAVELAKAIAKAGLIGMTRVWALELGQWGITANAIGPGPIRTELFDKANPQNPINRRISIVVMSKEALDASLGQVGDGQVTSSAPVADPDAQAPSGAAPAR